MSSKRSRKASAGKAKGVEEPIEAPSTYLRPTPKVKASPVDTKAKTPKRRKKNEANKN